ncbi:hypothetical protein LVJ85_05450 [Neisseria sp. Dent CA1/247]|uniref:hypothetical protein n=1 Tax=Neisseria sp. Dent CA1/247 TaxID=2912675 RepID=UPI001FD4C886|nr:hypothetical protein [Neisseria sp. Dent CA1/247]UOO77906.1 hypothetical protein LVJ85_05450 [Neisseria sp. Dent CA1/247]
MAAKNKPISRPCPVCGRVYEWRRASGRVFELCEHCRQPDCVVCGKKIPIERGRKNTCCTQCEQDKVRGIQNRFYAKRITEDPELNKRNHAARKEKRLSDPEKMRAHKQKEAERSKRRLRDPEYRLKRAEYQASRYIQNRDEINQQRADFWAALPEEEKEKRRILARERGRVWRQAERERLQKNPEEWEKYQAYQHAARQKYKQNQELAKLMKQTQELLNVAEQNKPKRDGD